VKLRRKPVVITLTIFLAITVTRAISYLYEFIQDHKTLPPVASHTDITNQPMQTFSQSLATNRPSDNSKYLDSSCLKLSQTWVADENLQKGVAMNVENWKNLDLKSANFLF